jgi:hypothetical protein
MTELKTMSHRKIGGIKLLNMGLKGVEITYETVETIGGKVYTSEDNKKSFRPAHRELKDLVKELAPHMMALTGYENELRLKDFEVISVKAGSDRFLISGKYRCWGDSIISVNTPLIKEVDGYVEYDDVSALVDKIYAEADLYLRGVKKIKNVDVISDYMKDVRKREDFDISNDFTSMSKEELDELLDEFQKDLGITVVMEGGKMVISSDDDEDIDEEVCSDVDSEVVNGTQGLIMKDGAVVDIVPSPGDTKVEEISSKKKPKTVKSVVAEVVSEPVMDDIEDNDALPTEASLDDDMPLPIF